MQFKVDKPPDGQGVLERVSAALRSQNGRMTDSRARIVRTALAMREPFTAKDLIRVLQREAATPISTPTVYRLLPILIELGVLRATPRSGAEAAYEVAVVDSPGHRMVCTQCGRTKRFESVVLDRLLQHLTRDAGFGPSPAGQRVLCRCEACLQRAGETIDTGVRVNAADKRLKAARR